MKVTNLYDVKAKATYLLFLKEMKRIALLIPGIIEELETRIKLIEDNPYTNPWVKEAEYRLLDRIGQVAKMASRM